MNYNFGTQHRQQNKIFTDHVTYVLHHTLTVYDKCMLLLALNYKRTQYMQSRFEQDMMMDLNIFIP